MDNGTETGGCGGAGSDQAWGAVATNVADPPACIEQCRWQFLNAVAPFYSEKTADERARTLAELCEVLSDVGPNSAPVSGRSFSFHTDTDDYTELTAGDGDGRKRRAERGADTERPLDKKNTTAGSGTLSRSGSRLGNENYHDNGDDDDLGDDKDANEGNHPSKHAHERDLDTQPARQLAERSQGDPRMWQLYCCDHTLCGVAPNESGQDPNVNRIINECQAINHHGVYDPGRPSVCLAAWASASNSTAAESTAQEPPRSNACPVSSPTAASASAEPSIKIQGIPESTNTGLIAPESVGPGSVATTRSSVPLPMATTPGSVFSTPQFPQSTQTERSTRTQPVISIAAVPGETTETNPPSSFTPPAPPAPSSVELSPSHPASAPSEGAVSIQGQPQQTAEPSSGTTTEAALTLTGEPPSISIIANTATTVPATAITFPSTLLSDVPTMAPIPVPSNGDFTSLDSPTTTPPSTPSPNGAESGSTNSDPPPGSSGLTQGALAGLVVGVIALALLISALVLCLSRRRHHRSRGQRLSSGDGLGPSSGLFGFLASMGRRGWRSGDGGGIRGLIRHPSPGPMNPMSASPLMTPYSITGNSVFGSAPGGVMDHGRDTGPSFDTGSGAGVGVATPARSTWSSRRRSSTSAALLTPPPPLMQRRMLSLTIDPQPASSEPRDSQARFDSNNTKSKPGADSTMTFGGPLGTPSPLSPQAVFPSSPTWSPTLAKLHPRQEKTPRLHGLGATGAPLSASSPNMAIGQTSAFPFPDRAFPLPHDSMGSLNGASAVQPASPLHSSTPPRSPSRPLRPHDWPLQIPDLVAPSLRSLSPGPPPTRGLPALPPPAATARGLPPTSPVPMAASRNGEPGPAARGSSRCSLAPTPGMSPQSRSRDQNSRGALSAMDESGSGPHPASASAVGSGRSRKATRAKSNASSELDLEQLAGCW